MYAVIDGCAIESREALHDAFARQLALPEWYGRSLDALHDCLSDIHEETEVRLVGADELVARLGVYAVALQTMLHDACAEKPRRRFVTEEKEA